MILTYLIAKKEIYTYMLNRNNITVSVGIHRTKNSKAQNSQYNTLTKLKFVPNLICNEIRQMVFKRLAKQNGDFYTNYTQREQIAGIKKRPSPAEMSWTYYLIG
jgi:hypothetical protein